MPLFAKIFFIICVMFFIITIIDFIIRNIKTTFLKIGYKIRNFRF